MGDEDHVAGGDLRRPGVHALGVESLEVRVDRVTAMMSASRFGTSAAKSAWNFAGSTDRYPPASGTSALPRSAGYLSPNAPIASPNSGANAARYTSAFTLGFPAAAPV